MSQTDMGHIIAVLYAVKCVAW